ncbi:MAG: trypsin-like peptidase domain-containing protein [Clostridiaceae bacterium]|nr:trypsin-like peptidase domain-containing protein [Clostridiaceae bacterium]
MVMMKKGLGLVLAVTVLLCGAAGFGGGMAAAALNRLNQTGAASAAITTTDAAIAGTSGGTSQQTATAAASTIKTASGQSGLSADLSVTEIAAIASPSVVEITTEVMVSGQRMQQYIAEGAGSGVIISADGLIITNNHVIEDANSIKVRLTDGTTYDATLVGTDAQTDVAVLKIDASGLTAVTFGDSDALAVGDLAVAIGNPLGELGGTVTDGIISALDREITIDDETMNLLQTNAAINPGNSGGGLFNSQGCLVGLVVAKSSGTDVEGLGFAIPVNDIVPIINQLIDYGYVQGRIDLGMTLIDISSEQTAMMYRVSQLGVYVLKVTDGSNAATAGFASGDCILSIDGAAVSASADLNTALDQHSVGDTVTIVVLRSNREISLQLKLDEYKPG